MTRWNDVEVRNGLVRSNGAPMKVILIKWTLDLFQRLAKVLETALF